jgi:hypothetical protein
VPREPLFSRKEKPQEGKNSWHLIYPLSTLYSVPAWQNPANLRTQRSGLHRMTEEPRAGKIFPVSLENHFLMVPPAWDSKPRNWQGLLLLFLGISPGQP